MGGGKLLVSVLLSVLFMLSFSISAFAFSGSGSGAIDDPFIITSWNQLNETRNNLSAHYELGAHLNSSSANFSDFAGWDANGGLGWDPIGNSSDSFVGSFDGAFYGIDDLVINRSEQSRVGLFAGVDGSDNDWHVIGRVRMQNVSIRGNVSVGALVGDSGHGDLTDIRVLGVVNGSTGSSNVGCIVGIMTYTYAEKMYANCNVSGGGGVGGIIGTATRSHVENSYSSGNINASGTSVGGLIGQVLQSIINSNRNLYSTATVDGVENVGGAFGRLVQSTVYSSFSTGAVYGTGSYVGGLIGICTFCSTYDSFWDNLTSNQTTSAGGTGKTTAQMKNITTFNDTATDGLTTAWDIKDDYGGKIWGIRSDVNDGYPFLQFDLGYVAYCTFRDACRTDETELLRAQNSSNGYYSSHVEITNATVLYNYSLCCSSGDNYTLTSSCAAADTTTLARASNTTNAHIQTGDQSGYAHGICLGATDRTPACTYVNGTCPSGYGPIMSMASSEGDNSTNAHVSEQGDYLLNTCCTISTAEPEIPTLLTPTNGNLTVFDRTLTLNWSDVVDADGDTVIYFLDLNVSTGSCAVEVETSTLSSSYTTSELCVDQSYNWTVRACDVDGCSAWASVWNFTIPSVLGIEFNQNVSSFGALLPLEVNDTEAGPGAPMELENTGNIVSNIDMNATGALFTNAGLDTNAFQFKIATSESGAFVSALNDTYYNVTSSQIQVITNISYVDAADDAFIHYKVTVPAAETPGVKSTTITTRVTAS